MADISTKIKDLQKALKIHLEDEKEMESNFESILRMFDELKNINVENYSSSLKRKKILIKDLRNDEVLKNDGFRKDLAGNYMEVPSVSKK